MDDPEELEAWGGGEYHCAAAYPSAARSRKLAKQNMHLFRLKNTRFDIIGGMLYFLLVVSENAGNGGFLCHYQCDQTMSDVVPHITRSLVTVQLTVHEQALQT